VKKISKLLFFLPKFFVIIFNIANLTCVGSASPVPSSLNILLLEVLSEFILIVHIIFLLF